MPPWIVSNEDWEYEVELINAPEAEAPLYKLSVKSPKVEGPSLSVKSAPPSNKLVDGAIWNVHDEV